MNFKVTKKAKVLLAIYSSQKKSFGKNCIGQWHYCALLCWAALWSSLLLTGCCHTHIRDNFSCFRYIGHGHVFHSPLCWYLVWIIIRCWYLSRCYRPGLYLCLTIYHIINISPSGQYLYSCSCKSLRHNPGLWIWSRHSRPTKRWSSKKLATRDDLVAGLITPPSSQDSSINYDINFSVAKVSLHDLGISAITECVAPHITCHFSFVFSTPLCPPITSHLAQ